MNTYHKINSIYKRDMKGNKLIEGAYSIPEFKYLKSNQWVWTEKINGTNIRIQWLTDPLISEVIIKGKTDKAEIPTFLLTKLQATFAKEKMLKVFGIGEEKPDICLYGEGYGARIQKGGGNYIKDNVDFILFDIKIGHWWLKREDIEKIAKQLNIKIVPIVGYGTLEEAVGLIKSKTLKSQLGNEDFLAEGIVIRPKIELKCRNGQRIIAKIKHKDF